ncbi:MAG: TRAP transporter large permease [Desulfatiglandales bacterium]
MELSHLVMLLILLGCMAATIPVFMCLLFTGVACFLLYTSLPLDILFQSMFRAMDNFSLVVVLYFILCGNIMTTGATVDKLIKFANELVSWLPGGLGMAGCIACALFGAVSGSTVATVVALGGFMIPALIAQGYPEKYSVGVMASSGNLGIIIPPSISMILYSMITNVSLEGLFLTGFVPGILIVILVSIYTYFKFRGNTSIQRLPLPSKAHFFRTLRECMWALFLPIIIFVGIFSGAFTANEAAVVACVYAFILEIFIHKAMTLKQAYRVTVNSAITSATLLIIVAGATAFGRYLTLENIPNRVAEAVVHAINQPWVFLLVVNILLLIVGMFMDVISATLILGPVLIPLLVGYNIDAMHFGLLMTVNLAIGYITPPMGVSLYIAGQIAKRDIIFVTRSVMPFIIIQLIVLFLMTYFPKVVLWLPRLFGYAHAVAVRAL